MPNAELNTIEPLVWKYKISGDKNYPELWRCLTKEEQAAAFSIKNTERRIHYVAARGLLRDILSTTVAEAPERLRIVKHRYGKPFLADYPEIAFNLSHTGDFIIIAVERECRLGIDMELCKPRAHMPGLVHKCFGEIEADWWRSLPESEQIREFYRFWTRKEALTKAVGRGIALGLDRCIINPQRQTTWLSVPDSCGPASIWHVRDIDLGSGICCALAADKAIAGIKPMKR